MNIPLHCCHSLVFVNLTGDLRVDFRMQEYNEIQLKDRRERHILCQTRCGDGR
jgi:hypothetical protein